MNRPLIEPRPLKGFRDTLPPSEMRRRALIAKLEKIFISFGYAPIDTPALEYAEILLGKGGSETDRQLYRFFDAGKRDVALRFDLTVPFARFMARHLHQLYLPFRRYQIAKVWRGENPQRGRFREFFQCDFDMVGVDSAVADLEILQMTFDSLSALGISAFSIDINHRSTLNHFLLLQGLNKKSEEILRIIDKLPKVGKRGVISRLETFASQDQINQILSFITPEDSSRNTLEKMSALLEGEFDEGLVRLESIVNLSEKLPCREVLSINPSITRGLDYYTGIVYETTLTDFPSLGAICSGGRYNGLTQLYRKEPLPGVGASIGLDRLLVALEEKEAQSPPLSPSQLLVTTLSEALEPLYQKIAGDLRKAGVACEVYPEKREFKTQLKYAQAKAIPFVLIYGDREHARGSAELKKIRNGWQASQFIDLSEISQRLASLIRETSSPSERRATE